MYVFLQISCQMKNFWELGSLVSIKTPPCTIDFLNTTYEEESEVTFTNVIKLESVLSFFIWNILEPQACWQEKQVGDTIYNLMTVGDTSKYGCVNGCIYVDRNQPGKKFCFKDGPLQAECKHDMGKGRFQKKINGIFH